MGKKSKDKGNRGERLVRKALEDWWGGEFTKTPGSGAFATNNKQFESMAGDVTTADESFPFCVESKNAEGWLIEELVYKPSSLLHEWINQTVDQAPAGQIPLLLFTRNYKPLFYLHHIKDMPWSVLPRNIFVYHGSSKDKVYVIGLWNEFTETYKPSDWIRG
jgi:hypothetical protein